MVIDTWRVVQTKKGASFQIPFKSLLKTAKGIALSSTPIYYFFSIIILITQTYKVKYYNHQVQFILPVPSKKERNKQKQFEIEVKMIIKMKKQFILKLANSFLFMSDTNKHTPIDLNC